MRLTACLISLTLSGCAALGSQRASSNPPPKALQAQEKSEEAAIASILQGVKSSSRTDYKIRSTDLLEFTVYREEDLKRTLRVSQQGTVSFPLVGEIRIGGLSVSEAQDVLAKKLADFLVNPQVTIFIKEYGNKQIYVLGEVKTPGSYELPTETRLTVVEAISKAGGFTAVASKDRTKVIRASNDGKNESFTIEVTAITTRGEKDKDLHLEPNDVVYVPQSLF